MTATAPNDPTRRRRWRRRLFLLVFLFLLVNLALAWIPRISAIHHYLAGRLEAKFGRPVEIGNFEIRVLGRPEVVANYVTVGEDPRFGHEFFLRAEQLTASLRWRSLLRGRVELGTLSLTRPSLNLVRLPNGQWNLESWLPAPQPASPGGPSARNPEGHLYHIEIDGGRINFKRGAEKHPFALVDVSGTFDQEAPSRWRLDVEASLMRAGVVVQEAGLLRVRGRIGGTAARLRPADLQIEWEDVSLADVLRLWKGQDYGVRGQATLEADAQSGLTGAAPVSTGYAPWVLRATARMRGIHRWDLPPRPGDPAVNLILEAVWKPEQARIEINRAQLEAPGSNVRAMGFYTWADRATRSATEKDLDLRFLSAGASMNDLLAWYRAFHSGVSEAANLDGNAGVDLHLVGWPLQIERGVLAVDGVQLHAPKLAAPLKVGRFLLKSDRGGVLLTPASLSFSGDDAPGRGRERLQLEGRLASFPRGPWEVHLFGDTAHVSEALAASAALGWAPPANWDIDGAASVELRWHGGFFPLQARALGSVDFRNVHFAVPFLNQPVQVRGGRLEIASGGLHFTLRSAEAFGARWSGTLQRREKSAPWEFVLSADRLEISEVARWMRPAERTLLARLAPLTTPSAPAAFPLHARGRLQIGQLWLRPLEWRRLRATVELDRETSWRLRLADGQAEFFGGTVSGSLDAGGEGPPSYRFAGQLARVNLAGLSASTPALVGRFAGSASAELQVAARGRNWDDLITSLEGNGHVDIRGGEIRGLDLFSAMQSGAQGAHAGSRVRTTLFQSAAGEFEIASRTITLDGLRLSTAVQEAEILGTVDFQRSLDLRVRALPRTLASRTPEAADTDSHAIRVSGTLEAPQVTVLEEAAGKGSTPAKPAKAAVR